ncbi:hypothetical protein EJ03DRAFT_327179 [Teratosphaeria nubilosa]|uniref:Uncharacterized protein n=1 Tax=Teratosphaeria nubilosa TaxID=161662 RepID=A0A6G1LBH5_9PEZI|nr:hypothetical protein EJ03DRAFT_327179 [Teratosphaeria nubilosa]
MARSPSDATRFTATGPYASSSTSFTPTSRGIGAGSQIDLGSAPANETAQQKIDRLRKAAAAARRGKESGFDSAIRIGRTWADRAHRVTAFGLIGLTVVSGAVATAGITDMILHNRRRKSEWLAEQQAKTARDLAIAKRDLAADTANEDQILLINRERAAMEADLARQNKPGMFKRMTNSLFGGLEKEERRDGPVSAVAAQAESAVQGVREQILGQDHDRSVVQAVGEKMESNRRQAEKLYETAQPLGGPLDRQAAEATTAVSQAGRSWTSWLTGRS